MKPDFGIFEPVFQSAHGYLALLHLGGEDAATAVAQVRDCCRTVPDPFPDICCLLAESNWRPHLVAAVAAIVSGYHEETAQLLWRRLDRGSWVTPQIGIALSLIDPDFAIQARSRLKSGCPLDTTELRAMDPIERHSAAGPAGTTERSAKAAQTLLLLAKLISPCPPWVENLRASGELQRLLQEDSDRADLIVPAWLESIRRLTASSG